SSQLATEFASITHIRYSHSHWCSLLRDREGMYFYKPRPRDYHRAEEAPEQLRQRIKATVDAIQAMGIDPERVKWGFSDEVAAQRHVNNARFWAFEPHLCRVVNTDRGSQSFFGFYGLNAISQLVTLADGKTEAITEALLWVKSQQTDGAALIIFWDNATTHTALNTWGWEHRIFFIYIPAYSPDLNPIEKIWKGVKRWMTEQSMLKNMDELVSVFHAGFDQFKDKLSFIKSWWEQYGEEFSGYSPMPVSNTLQ
ncbi:IS630 family transposase, partial [Spirosoma utsteinense]